MTKDEKTRLIDAYTGLLWYLISKINAGEREAPVAVGRMLLSFNLARVAKLGKRTQEIERKLYMAVDLPTARSEPIEPKRNPPRSSERITDTQRVWLPSFIRDLLEDDEEDTLELGELDALDDCKTHVRIALQDGNSSRHVPQEAYDITERIVEEWFNERS